MPKILDKNPADSPPVYSRGVAWVDTSLDASAAPASKLLPAGPSCQPCPDCGGLDCLCRPRFFAGQLLTEQDLNRLDRYIVAKNQLHNRYLVGTGVVCGLEVECSPCANTVSVSSGYAIDTCGNDIIVCSGDTVEICKLIKACTPSSGVNCAPYKDTSRCKDATQQWILAIRYLETPSRGATALTGSSQCSCGAGSPCSCGSAVSKACGCGSKLPAASCCGETMGGKDLQGSNLPRRGAPPSCEPTLTCETYRYEVFLAPPAPKNASPIGGEMLERMACCLNSILAILPAALDSKDLQNETALSAYCCDMRLALIQYVQANGGTKCAAYGRLRAIECPAPGRSDFGTLHSIASKELLLVLVELALDCICLAALPPCPAPGDPRVPLAAITVRPSDCAVLSVCDWTPYRKFVVTNKTLGYWLGWLPIVPLLRQFMQDLCCRVLGLPDTLGRRGDTLAQTQDVTAARQPGDVSTTQEPTLQDIPISFATRNYQAGTPFSEAVTADLAGGQASITAALLMTALTTAPDLGASAQTLAASPHAQVLAEIARPLLKAFAPLVSAASGRSAQNAPLADAQKTEADIGALRAELDAMKTTLASQQAALTALRPPPPADPKP